MGRGCVFQLRPSQRRGGRKKLNAQPVLRSKSVSMEALAVDRWDTGVGGNGGVPTGQPSLRLQPNLEGVPMKKHAEPMAEVVRDAKPPFRKLQHQPKKALRHRYERRKIKAYLNLANWLSEETA